MKGINCFATLCIIKNGSLSKTKRDLYRINFSCKPNNSNRSTTNFVPDYVLIQVDLKNNASIKYNII